MVTKSFKTRLDESVQDASLLGLGLGFALVYYFSKGGRGRVFGGSRDFGDRAWIEGCCCVCTNSFEGLYFRGWDGRWGMGGCGVSLSAESASTGRPRVMDHMIALLLLLLHNDSASSSSTSSKSVEFYKLDCIEAES